MQIKKIVLKQILSELPLLGIIDGEEFMNI